MKIRTEIYDKFWWYIAERQNMFWKRYRGESPPWTDDWVLANHRFTNVYRCLDRVSQYLIKNVQQNHNWGYEDSVFRTILFKTFNLISTWEYFVSEFGEPTLDNFDFHDYDNLLTDLMSQKIPIYNNAYMHTGHRSFGFDTKHANHLAMFEMIFYKDKIFKKLLNWNCESMEQMYKILVTVPFHGPFLAMQYCIDLNYLDWWQFSENDFIQAGPGAKRGLTKIFSERENRSDEYLIEFLTEGLPEEMMLRELDWHPLPGHPPTLMDIQNCLCELDKATRVWNPELKTGIVGGHSSRTRIKRKYNPNTDPKPMYDIVFPRWWGIKMEE